MTGIEWTDATWNPLAGCTIKSEGCKNCYAMTMAHRLEGMGLPAYQGTTTRTKGGQTLWTGKVNFSETALLKPLSWKKPRMIFVNSMSDLFHESVTDEWLDRVFAVMALCPQHTFQILTKRADRMREYCQSRFETEHGSELLCEAIEDIDEFNSDAGGDHDAPLPNVWLGVSVENQAAADERIPDLLNTPAAVRWISAEPLLGPVDLTRWLHDEGCPAQSTFCICSKPREVHLNWVVCGGESGPKARPLHPDWARSLRDQCADAGVPFLFKQWGEWAPSTPEEARGNPRSGWQCLAGHPHLPKTAELYPEAGAAFIEHKGKKAAGRHLDGVLHDAYPAREG